MIGQWLYCPNASAHPNDEPLCAASCRWACNHPEAPHGPGVSYDADCRPCMVAASAAIATGFGDSEGYDGSAFIPLAEWFAIVTGTGCRASEEEP
jgi:hypothetical protein